MNARLLKALARVKALLHLAATTDGPSVAWPARSGWRRAAPLAFDRVLLSETHLWLRRIPSALLPKHLCRHHPHLANRFAACWGDRGRVEALVDELLVDRRGGRKGFSPRVQAELAQLERLHARWLADPFGGGPALVPRRRRMRLGGPVFEATFPGAVALNARDGAGAQRSSSSISRL